MATTTREILQELQSKGDAFYTFDRMELYRNVEEMFAAFEKRYRNFTLAYSFKTNYLADICKSVKKYDVMAEVVSPYEYVYAKKLGFSDKEIIFNGVTPDPCLKALAAGNGCLVNVDNYHELSRIVSAAEVMKRRIKVGLRVNFEITNGLNSRFGIDVNDGEELKKCVLLLNTNGYVRLAGLHCHIGSSRPAGYWLEKAAEMCVLAKKLGAGYIDLGGGMFGHMPDELARQFDGYVGSFDTYAELICRCMNKFFPDESCELILEPGTALVGNTMSMMAMVTGIKTVRGKTHVTVNCNSNHLGVIADMKELPFRIYHTEKSEGSVHVEHATVGGNTCLEYDYLLRDFTGTIAIGDCIEFLNVGAYSIGSSRQFIVPRPEVRDAKTMEVLRPAETEEDMFRTYLA